MKKQTKNIKTFLRGPIYIWLGVLCLLSAVSISFLNYRSEKELTDTLEQVMAQYQALDESAINQSGSVSDNSSYTKVEYNQAVGIMEIPSIGMKASIVEGTDEKTLKSSLGHLSGTALVGSDTGNCVIAGHRNYTFGRYFSKLNEVDIGDKILVTDMTGMACEYIVTETKVVKPQDISVLADTKEPTLTLITCTPMYIATHRLIVTAVKSD